MSESTAQPPVPPRKLLLAWFLGMLITSLIGVMVVATGLDQKKSLTPYRLSALYGVGLVVLIGTAVTTAVLGLRWHRRKVDHGTLLIRIVLLVTLPLTLLMAAACGNIWLDGAGTDFELVVTDVFEVQRSAGTLERCIALSGPAEIGIDNDKVWKAQRWVDLRNYPVGTRIKATHHGGFFGQPWTEIHDRTLVWSCYVAPLMWKARGVGTVVGATGQFSPGSPWLALLRSWKVPVDTERPATAIVSPE